MCQFRKQITGIFCPYLLMRAEQFDTIYKALRDVINDILLFTEKVTKYCDELGNWVQSGSTCQPASEHKSEVLRPHLLLYKQCKTEIRTASVPLCGDLEFVLFSEGSPPFFKWCSGRANHSGNRSWHRRRQSYGNDPWGGREMLRENEERSAL